MSRLEWAVRGTCRYGNFMIPYDLDWSRDDFYMPMVMSPGAKVVSERFQSLVWLTSGAEGIGWDEASSRLPGVQRVIVAFIQECWSNEKRETRESLGGFVQLESTPEKVAAQSASLAIGSARSTVKSDASSCGRKMR